METIEFDIYKRGSVRRPPIADDLFQPGPSHISEAYELGPIGKKVTSLHRPIQSHINVDSYVSLETVELHAEKIVEQLEEDDTLMEDTPISEELRKETLRELPQCLTVKRCVRAKLSKSVSLKSKRRTISCWKSMKYRCRIKCSNISAKILEKLAYLELWYSTLKKIEGHFGSGYASYFKFLRWLFLFNISLTIPAICFIIVPQMMFDVAQNTTGSTFGAKDIFTGGGFFLNTTLYYGHYTNDMIVLIDNLYYNMPLAYITVMLILYLISFVILSMSVASSYRRNFIETEGGAEKVFANKIFCGWDYGIATKHAAELKSESIFTELKELLSEQSMKNRKNSCMDKFRTMTIQTIVNFLIIVLLGGIGYGLWKLLRAFETEPYAAIISNILILVLPIFLEFLSRYEDYSNPRTAMYITLIRTYLLGLVLVGVTSAYFLIEKPKCFESRLGQEIYRFMIYDFLFSVVLNSLIDLGWYLLMRIHGEPNPTKEFNVARHTLQIIYNQGLFLVGFLYSPFLSVIVVIKMFIIWYVRDITLMKICRPLTKSWRAAQTTTYFLMMTFMTSVLVLALHGYTMTSIETSKSCGPFKEYNFMYEVILGKDVGQNSTARDIILFITKPWVVSLILIALGIAVYVSKERADAQREKVRILKELLTWEAKDKEFLLHNIAKTTRGRFAYNNKGRADRRLTSLGGENYRDSLDTSSIFNGGSDVLYNYKKYT